MKSLARLSHRMPLASELAPRSAPRSISSRGIEKRRRKAGSEELEEGEVEGAAAVAAAASPPLAAAAASFPRLRAFWSLSMLPPTSERTMAARAAPKWPRKWWRWRRRKEVEAVFEQRQRERERKKTKIIRFPAQRNSPITGRTPLQTSRNSSVRIDPLWGSRSVAKARERATNSSSGGI